MQEGSKISVIIPVYNVEKYVSRCIESVINQTYKNLEIIIVDDGATDHSYQICQKYAEQDSRICLYQKQNGGLADARNYGLERATGEYIGYVDSDDYIELEMYEKLVKLALKYDADVVACRHKEEINGVVACVEESQQVHIMTGEEMLSWYITKEAEFEGHISPSVWDRLYKTETIRDIRFSKGRNYEDIVYTTEVLLKAKKCVYYDYGGYIYEIRQGSISNGGNIVRELEDELFQFKRRMTVLEEHERGYYLPKCKYDLFHLIIAKRLKYANVTDERVKKNLVEYKNEMKKIKKDVQNYVIEHKLPFSKLVGINLACYAWKMYSFLIK